MSIAIENGAEDLKTAEDSYEIITGIKDYEKVRAALKNKGLEWEAAELTMIPTSFVKLEGKNAEQVLGLMESLEDNDDVQNVYANFDIPDEILRQQAR